MSVTVIADIVGSRLLDDRQAAQRELERAIDAIEADLPLAVHPLHATVGDELQGLYPDLASALRALLLLQLRLPDGLECRFGVGVGDTRVLESVAGEIPEGPGWWAARAAIDEVHEMGERVVVNARTRVARDGAAEATSSALVNAYLLARDDLVVRMPERTRRLVYGRCLGRTQRELAQDEGVSQSAVSQALSTSGAAAVVAGFRELEGDT